MYVSYLIHNNIKFKTITIIKLCQFNICCLRVSYILEKCNIIIHVFHFVAKWLNLDVRSYSKYHFKQKKMDALI
jgi:hypothetical protein